MKRRILGKNGPSVSALGLGCKRMSNFPGTVISRYSTGDDESVATIEAALDAGINLLNTGDFYGMGHNELLVRQAIRNRRDQAFLSVKFGAQKSPSGRFLGADLRGKSVKNYAAYSLQRLDVEVIDLYQPGRLDPTIPIEETVGAIVDLIQEGKVRYLGLSEVSAAQLRKAHSIYPVSALEIEYSLTTRFIEREILATARELGVSIVAYNVFSNGQLARSGKTGSGSGDYRSSLLRFLKDTVSRDREKWSFLDSLAAARDCTPAQLALAWTLAQGNDIVPLVGMSRRSRLPENIAALDIALSADDLSELNQLFAPDTTVRERGPQHVRRLSFR
jgi:aryl-alcohol dehydrogenase-like predicted oxidoreductase